MPFWLIAAILIVATTVVSALLAPRPKDAKASALGDFQVPTAEEGRALPVVAGTCIIRAPNVVWYGDLQKAPYKKKSGLFSKSIVGYFYFLGMQLALCHGTVDSLVQIRAGNDKVVPGGTATPGANGEAIIQINAEDLFGGKDKEGGLKGQIRFYSGKAGQPSNAYLASKLGVSPAPAWSGLCHAVFEASSLTKGRPFYVGMSHVVKDMAFVVRRLPKNLGLAAGRENIGGDANPAEWIYEIMTNAVWGMGTPAARFDLASFQAAGDTLWTESMGISQQLDSDSNADQVIGDILRHIDGSLYTDPATGLWTLKLIRADYDPATLLELTQDDILEAPEFGRATWSETLNEIKVKYLDRATWKERPVQAQETANHAVRGEVASDTLSFLGFSNATVANKVAMRELKIHSYPLAKVRIVANRKAWNLRIGGVFKFTWVPFGITGMVVRITQINYGALENSRIEIDAAEDIFSVGLTAYEAPTDTGWVDPVTDPVPPTAQRLDEVPYHLSGGGARQLAVMAVRGENQSDGYQVWSDEGAGYYQSNTVETFAPSGTLVSAYLRNTAALDNVGFVIQGGRDIASLESTDAGGRVRGDMLVLIDDEWMSATTVTDNGDGTYTLAGVVRGIFDSIPADHSAGARAWFFSDGTGLLMAGLVRDLDYPSDITVNAKCLPFSHKLTVPIASVSAVSKLLASRAQKPYPPGKVQVNSVYWPVGTREDATPTWQHRIRTAQPGVVQQDAASVAGVIEGTYTVEVYVGGVLKQTYAALTGTSQAYTAMQRFLDDADGSKTVKFRIKPINAALTGTVRDTDAFTMGGLGMALGLELGGRNG